MFNKYRGQPQVKKINRSFDKEVLVRKPQPKPPGEEEAEVPPILSSFDDVSEARMRSEAENDLLRQQEEDEWFRLFKGDPKTESGEDKQSDKMDSDGETGSNRDANPEEEQLAEEPDPAYEDPMDDSSEAIERYESSFSKKTEPEKTEDFDVGEVSEEFEETTVNSEDSNEDTAEEKSSAEESYSAEVDSENNVLADDSIEAERLGEDSDPKAEEDDEQWIQDLLIDIQDKTRTDAVEQDRENPVESQDEEAIFMEMVDESAWYQSTPLIRTAALIVLEMSDDESERSEDSTENRPAEPDDSNKMEDSSGFVARPEELLDPVDEQFEDETDEVLRSEQKITTNQNRKKKRKKKR